MATANPDDSNAAELMSAALDEQLEGDDAEAFEAMLAESPDAAAEFKELQDMLKLVKELPEVEAPPDFYEKVAKKIRRRKLMRGQTFLLISLPFQVLSVMIVAVIAVTYMMIQLERDPASKLQRDPAVTAPGDASSGSGSKTGANTPDAEAKTDAPAE